MRAAERSATATDRIRRFRRDDAPHVVAMLAGRDPWRRLGYTRATWLRLLAPPLRGRDAWILEDPRGCAGFALVRRGFLRGDYLELLVIAPGRERRGAGRMLLESVERRVFARAANLFVCVSDFNVGARAFYRRLGYRTIGAIPDLLAPGSAELLLRKQSPDRPPPRSRK